MKIFVIAEIGSVHDGSFGNAQRLIEAAADCGADAVKFQMHIAEAETLRNAPNPPYFTQESRYDYFRRTAFTLDEWRTLKSFCERLGVEFLCSPFSLKAVVLLEQLGVKRYKIPSGEVTNIPLLKRIVATRKPILLSSGMNSWAELDQAVETLRRRTKRITVLQCTSEYPCPYERVGLNVLQEMRERYRLPVGLSDHTLTNYAAFAAAMLGAETIEKHFTLSRKMYGSDAKHSLEPAEFAEMIRGIRAIETMLGSPVDKNKIGRYRAMKQIFQKSLVTRVNVAEGTTLTAEMLDVKKPGSGIPAAELPLVLGRKSGRTIKADTLLRWKDLRNGKHSGLHKTKERRHA